MVGKVKEGVVKKKKGEIVINKGMKQLNFKMKQDFFHFPTGGQGKQVRQLLRNEVVKLGNDKVLMSCFQNFPWNCLGMTI